MRNRYPSPALMQEIANLRFEFIEEECRKRAERLAEHAPEARRRAAAVDLYEGGACAGTVVRALSTCPHDIRSRS